MVKTRELFFFRDQEGAKYKAKQEIVARNGLPDTIKVITNVYEGDKRAEGLRINSKSWSFLSKYLDLVEMNGQEIGNLRLLGGKTSYIAIKP